jgi:hypothetical protein
LRVFGKRLARFIFFSMFSSFMDCSAAVRVSRGTVSLPTCLPAPPDKNPIFPGYRVYQGSSGKVHPLVADFPGNF